MNGSIAIIGVAQPQGNKSAFVRNGRAVMVEGRRGKSRAAFKNWRAVVAREAQEWCKRNGMPAPIDGPLEIWMTFFMPRPNSAPKRVTLPATRPDVDKLTRLIFDSLTGVIYSDDSRVVDAHISKRFAIGRPPGAEIRWQAL